jgi:hypothetical protein
MHGAVSGEPATFVRIAFAAVGGAHTERMSPPDRGQHSRQGSAGVHAARFVLVGGPHRLEAAKGLGEETIAAFLVDTWS